MVRVMYVYVSEGNNLKEQGLSVVVVLNLFAYIMVSNQV